jgi:hypothetical protein
MNLTFAPLFLRLVYIRFLLSCLPESFLVSSNKFYNALPHNKSRPSTSYRTLHPPLHSTEHHPKPHPITTQPQATPQQQPPQKPQNASRFPLLPQVQRGPPPLGPLPPLLQKPPVSLWAPSIQLSAATTTQISRLSTTEPGFKTR